MNAIEIKYDYVDNSRVQRSAVCTRLSLEGAVAVAADRLSATQLQSGDWIYLADEDREYYVASPSEMARLGAAYHAEPYGDVYSIWCAYNGRPATDKEIVEVES